MNHRKMSIQYKKTNVETASRLDLVIICYEKAIQLLIQAKAYLKDEDFEQKGRTTQKALGIISELQSCLNFDEGGQIARNLDAIYTYLTKRLLHGDINRDLTIFDEAVIILSELKGAWEEILSDGKDRISSATIPDQLGNNAPQIAA